MPEFTDAENLAFKTVPAGDYVWEVIGFEQGISTSGGPTKGSASYEFILALTQPGSDLQGRCWETMYDHPKTAWKLDCFLKSAGVAIVKGEAYEFALDEAQKLGVKHVPPIGLRGWASVGLEEKLKEGKPTGEHRNRISTFYTNKPKLAPVPQKAAPAPAEGLAEEDVPFD